MRITLASPPARTAFVLNAAAFIVCIGALTCAGQLVAETEESAGQESSEARLGEAVSRRFRVGAKFVARGATVQNIRAMVAVPLECDEQQVEIVDEDFSSGVETLDYRDTDEGVRQLLIYIPTLPPRAEEYAYVTFDVVTSPVLAPADTASLAAPGKVEYKLKRYLGRSPYIDTGHRKIKAAVRDALARREKRRDKAAQYPAETDGDADTGYIEVTSADVDLSQSAEKEAAAVGAGESTAAANGPPTDWERVEALYDYAIEHVKYEEGADKSSVQALEEERGDCQAIAALFVAMCRTEKIPARMVWVDGHQYAEFYLEDAEGAGRWFPVESAGQRAFGEMPLARVILQKGDNFRVPERPRDRLRYATDYTMLLAKPGAQPKITYIREQL